MKTIRIIPKLDIKGPNLVKGIHLEGLRVLGKPEDFAKYYFENGADELLYMDVVASLYERNSLHDIIRKTAEEIFIPLTVGGGLRTIDDIRQVLRSGADKVSLNTAAVKNPVIIKQASEIFGSSTVAVSIEAIKQPDGKYFVYIDNGREETGLDVLEWARKAESLGAGEIIVTSVDREGTGGGYDIELTKMVSQSVSVPVVACGGAGSPEDVYQVIKKGGADAVIIASMLHYNFIRRKASLIQNHNSRGGFEEEGNIEFLKNKTNYTKIKPASLSEIKKYLKNKGLPIRI